MGPELVSEIARNAIILSIKMGGPMLVAGLVIGLGVSIFQAATQINEQTLTFIPKIVGIIVTLALLSPWIFSSFEFFAVNLIQRIPYYVLGR